MLILQKKEGSNLRCRGEKILKTDRSKKKKNQCNKNGQQKKISEIKRFSEINKTDKPLARQIKENK